MHTVNEHTTALTGKYPYYRYFTVVTFLQSQLQLMNTQLPQHTQVHNLNIGKLH